MDPRHLGRPVSRTGGHVEGPSAHVGQLAGLAEDRLVEAELPFHLGPPLQLELEVGGPFGDPATEGGNQLGEVPPGLDRRGGEGRDDEHEQGRGGEEPGPLLDRPQTHHELQRGGAGIEFAGPVLATHLEAMGTPGEPRGGKPELPGRRRLRPRAVVESPGEPVVFADLSGKPAFKAGGGGRERFPPQDPCRPDDAGLRRDACGTVPSDVAAPVHPEGAVLTEYHLGHPFRHRETHHHRDGLRGGVDLPELPEAAAGEGSVEVPAEGSLDLRGEDGPASVTKADETPFAAAAIHAGEPEFVSAFHAAADAV